MSATHGIAWLSHVAPEPCRGRETSAGGPSPQGVPWPPLQPPHEGAVGPWAGPTAAPRKGPRGLARGRATAQLSSFQGQHSVFPSLLIWVNRGPSPADAAATLALSPCTPQNVSQLRKAPPTGPRPFRLLRVETAAWTRALPYALSSCRDRVEVRTVSEGPTAAGTRCWKVPSMAWASRLIFWEQALRSTPWSRFCGLSTCARYSRTT